MKQKFRHALGIWLVAALLGGRSGRGRDAQTSYSGNSRKSQRSRRRTSAFSSGV